VQYLTILSLTVPDCISFFTLTDNAICTCNSILNTQVTISATNVEPFYLGMSSQATEREETIITPDFIEKVFGLLEYSRHDLMAINMQRARVVVFFTGRE